MSMDDRDVYEWETNSPDYGICFDDECGHWGPPDDDDVEDDE